MQVRPPDLAIRAGAAQLEPGSDVVLRNYGMALIENNRPVEGRAILVTLSYHSQALAFFRGQSLARRGIRHPTRNYLLVAAELAPDSTLHWNELAAFAFDTQDYELFMAATAQLESFAETHEDIWADYHQAMWLFYWLGQRYRLESRYADIKWAFDGVLRADGAFPFASLAIGEALALAGKCEQALPYLQHSLGKLPQSAWPPYWLGVCLEKTGQEVKARQAFEAAQSLDNPSPSAIRSWGRDFHWIPLAEMPEYFGLDVTTPHDFKDYEHLPNN